LAPSTGDQPGEVPELEDDVGAFGRSASWLDDQDRDPSARASSIHIASSRRFADAALDVEAGQVAAPHASLAAVATGSCRQLPVELADAAP
jgi:hypothetical protein